MAQSTAGTLLKLVAPTYYGLRNFYAPLLVSLSLFVLLSPGYFVNFRGTEGVVRGTGTVGRRDVQYHSFVYIAAWILLALLLSVFRLWPGTQVQK
jgi:hypothetical protein